MAKYLAEEIAVVGTIDPASLSAGAVNTDVIDMQKFDQVMFVIATGVMGTNATADFAVYGDTTSGGSFATKITGKDSTQIVKASGDNVQAVMNVSAGEVITQGFRYIRGKLTIATAASIATVVVLGGHLGYGPVRTADLSTVGEIVG